MAQVKFLQGLRENLPSELSPGAIYFTQDERKLYIDTELVRLPVVGDCGKIFYLKFNNDDWTSDKNDKNNLTKPSIFITDYIETYTDNTAKIYSLDQLYHEEIILFTGTVFYLDNQNNKKELSNIICKGFEKNTDGKIGLKFQYVGSDFSASFPIDDTALKIYIQMYTPNPKSTAYTPQTINTTIYTNSYKLRGQEFWEPIDTTDLSKGYKQSIQVFGVDLTKQPYIVSRNDDSLENEKEYNKIEDIETSYENNISTLTFKVKDQPTWVISIDLFIMLDIPNNNNECEWSVVTIPADVLSSINDINEFQITYDNNNFYKLKPIIGTTESRELIVFCTQENNELYKNIIDVGYSNLNNSFTFTFNPEVKNLTDIKDTTLYICQMNNVANQIITATIESDTWKEYETQTENAISKEVAPYYVSVFSPSIAFLGKHQPLIYALENSETIFDKINEIKIYNGSLLLYSKELIKEDIKLKIIDFK